MSKATRFGRAPSRREAGSAAPGGGGAGRLGELLERGLKQQANRLRRFLALRELGLPCATLLAGRLAPALGGARLGDALVLRAVRLDASSPEARYHAARAIFARSGPIVTWLRMRQWGDELDARAPRHLRARWLALRASVAACFRDFDAAEGLLAAAERLTPGLPGVDAARAELLIQQDRRDDALAAVRRAVRRKPWHVDAALTAAGVMLTLGRGAEACDLLLDAAVDSEDSRLMLKLAEHLAEQRRFRECLEWLQRHWVASPLLDREGLGLAAALHSRASAALGEPCWRGPDRPAEAWPGRVLLSVPFVQQDRYSCSPATLTELAAFWRRPADQREVAETICYDGTPRHRARAWAEQHGFVVREFRVTWDSARAVLERGVPFALVTQWGMAGHDQAVVGYDERRGSLLIRCPSRPFLVEASAQELLAAQAWCGPRGTALLPELERTRLSGLELPDAEAYDHLHAIEGALAEHRRDGARAVAASLARQQPASRLNVWAALLIARYDCDHAAVLRSVEALLEAFPGTPALELWRLHALSSLASPAAYARMLAATCRKYPRDPALQSMHAYELSRDPERSDDAWSALRPALRRGHWPTLALELTTLATLLASHAFEDSQALVALAAHAGDLQEWPAMTYFLNAWRTNRTDEALTFLRARFEANGRLSGDPAQSLYSALRSVGDEGGAVAVLEQALSLRPGDPELRLFAAQACASRGALERAESLLAEARGRTRRARWLRTAAAVARSRGDMDASLRLWREVLAIEPAAVDAHQAVVNLLARMGQRSEAAAHLCSARRRFPANHYLAQLQPGGTG